MNIPIRVALMSLVGAAVCIIEVPLAHAATLALSPSSGTYNVGDTITVSVLLNTEGAAIDGTDMRYLNYNPAQLELQDDGAGTGVQILPGNLMPNVPINSADTVAGNVSFSEVVSGGTTFTNMVPAVLATMRFRVLAAGTTTVSANFTTGNTLDANIAVGGSDALSGFTNATFSLATSNHSPTANAGPDQSAAANQSVTFSGSGSDADGDTLTYSWNFGDGQTALGATSTHAYTAPGTYTATLTVSDGHGGSTEDFALITVIPPAKFSIGERVQVFQGPLNVRSCAGTTCGTLGTQPNGAAGTVLAGPTTASGYTWWQLDYDTGPDGWSVETYLQSGTVLPPPNPLLAYAFDENTGTQAADASGSNNHGQLLNSPTWITTGKYQSALSFDGTNDRVQGPTLTIPATFTYTAWIYNPSRTASETIATVGPNRQLYLANGALAFWNGTQYKFGSALSNNAWHHVAFVSDGTTIRAYVDGLQRGGTKTLALSSASAALAIGAWSSGTTYTEFFAGRIDNVRVYQKALTQTEVQNDMATAITVTPALGMVAPDQIGAIATTLDDLNRQAVSLTPQSSSQIAGILSSLEALKNELMNMGR